MDTLDKPRNKTNWGFLFAKLVLLADPGKRGLNCSEKGVLQAIADHMGRKKTAWPGFGVIAHYAGIDRSTAIRTVRRLTQRGVLLIVDGPKDSNHYQIDLRVLHSLITKPKYVQKARGLLARLSSRAGPAAKAAVVYERPRGTTPPGGWQDATTSSGTTPPPSGRTPPERTQERPTRTRSENAPPGAGRGDLRSEQGGERLSGFIKNHEVAGIIEAVESLTAGLLTPSTRPADSVANSLVCLLKEVKEEGGSYPLPEQIADALGDKELAGLRGLSFGLLTAPRLREKFKRLLVRRVQNRRLETSLLAQNAADGHDRAVGEAKRETIAQARRLPLWLERLHEQKPDDPDIQAWVAEELAKPMSAEPVPVPSSADSRPERPLGYDWKYALAASVENLRSGLDDDE